MFEKELYKAVLGDENAPWSAFLGQVEIFYSRSRVNTLLRIYRKFTKELGMTPDDYFDVPLSRLEALLPVVEANNRQEWVDKARVLLRKDFDIELRQAKGLPFEDDDHEHDMVQYEICSRCGLKTKHDHAQSEN